MRAAQSFDWNRSDCDNENCCGYNRLFEKSCQNWNLEKLFLLVTC